MMPLYDFQCKKCSYEFEEFKKIKDYLTTSCPECGGESKLLITCRGRDWFRPFVSEDFDGTPILVKTKEHYKKLCRKHGVYSKAL